MVLECFGNNLSFFMTLDYNKRKRMNAIAMAIDA